MPDRPADDPRWRPYPAEVPTEDDEYLVTKYAESVGRGWLDVMRWDGRGWPEHVVAWMPVAAPYRGEG